MQRYNSLIDKSADVKQSNNEKDKNENYQDAQYFRAGSPTGDDLDKVSVPSELSEDVWGELPKYQYLKYQE